MHRFRNRFNLKNIKIIGEAASADEEAAATFPAELKKKLPRKEKHNPRIRLKHQYPLLSYVRERKYTASVQCGVQYTLFDVGNVLLCVTYQLNFTVLTLYTLPPTTVGARCNDRIVNAYLRRCSFGNIERPLFVSEGTISQHWRNHESIPVSYLCINTYPATKEALISHECISVISLIYALCS